jgi:hypothetical protein
MDALASTRPQAWSAVTTSSQSQPRVLVAPIPVTPTKPLMPSHVKFLLWVDVLYRATARIASAHYLYGHTAGNACQQTLGFWEYLDRTVGDADYSEWTEEAIGERYVQYQSEPTRVPYAELLPYLDAYEHDGWMHAASARLLRIWSSHYAALGVYDPGLAQPVRAPIGIDELIDTLRVRGLCLDMRAAGDGVYLDATAHGLPLRRFVTSDGQANYLACTLRDIVPLIPHYDEIVLIYDREMSADYVLLQRILGELGGNATRIAVDRVAVNGVVQSSRHGGWKGHTVPEIAAACSADDYPANFRLGLRLFYLATIGIGEGQSFDLRLLRRRIQTAEALLACTASDTGHGEFSEFLQRFTGDHAYVDPYRLTTSLLARGTTAPIADLVKAIFL